MKRAILLSVLLFSACGPIRLPCQLTPGCMPAPTPTPTEEPTPEPRPTPSPEPTVAPTSTPDPTPTASPTPAGCVRPSSCPCLGRLAIGGTPHAIFERRIRIPDGSYETMPCHRYDLTPRFGIGGGGRGQACNDDHHAICSSDGDDHGACWRRCEPPGDAEGNRPEWKQQGARYSFVVGEWGYQFDVCGYTGEGYTITVDAPNGMKDGEGRPLTLCGDVRDSRSGEF